MGGQRGAAGGDGGEKESLTGGEQRGRGERVGGSKRSRTIAESVSRMQGRILVRPDSIVVDLVGRVDGGRSIGAVAIAVSAKAKEKGQITKAKSRRRSDSLQLD